MSELPELTCDVCGKNKAVGVTASLLGPFNCSYCKECLDNNAQPA